MFCVSGTVKTESATVIPVWYDLQVLLKLHQGCWVICVFDFSRHKIPLRHRCSSKQKCRDDNNVRLGAIRGIGRSPAKYGKLLRDRDVLRTGTVTVAESAVHPLFDVPVVQHNRGRRNAHGTPAVLEPPPLGPRSESQCQCCPFAFKLDDPGKIEQKLIFGYDFEIEAMSDWNFWTFPNNTQPASEVL